MRTRRVVIVLLASCGLMTGVRPLEAQQEQRIVRIPTVAVTADLDMTREVADLLQKSVPGARQVRIHAAGHLVQMDNPAEFNRIVLAFLHEVDGRR